MSKYLKYICLLILYIILVLLNDRALAEKMGKMNVSIVNERADVEKNYPKFDSIYDQIVQSENYFTN